MTRLILILAILGFNITISAQASIQGMSVDRLEKISTMLEDQIEQNRIPGAVALITRNGIPVYHEAFGVYKKSSIFRIASQSKAITSTAVMILWEEGRFRLDDPISKFIPEFKNPQVLESFNEVDSTYTSRDAEREITIRDLLTHQSGLGYGVIDGDERFRKIYKKAGITDLFTTEDISIGESVKKLAKLPLHHDPGARFTYSEGLDVLGYFIEIVSGQPFDKFLKQEIFEPLGMEDTWFYLPEEKHERLVDVTHFKDGVWSKYPVTFYDTDYPKTGAKTFFSGGAGLSSTPTDYAKFLNMYLSGGKVGTERILSRTTIKTMMENQLIGESFGNQSHGLAFGLVNLSGLRRGGVGDIGTFEWGGYFNTQYFADPSENLVGVLMKQTQGNTGDESGWKFRQMVFAAIDE